MSGLSDIELSSPDRAGGSARKSRGLGLIAVAVASSLIASTCCVLPLILVLAGIGGAWMTNLASLKPLTPVFTCIAIGALGWAGYLVFRPANSCRSSDGTACGATQRFTKWIFVVCALFIALLLLFPLAAPYFY